jgi:hypothetical protein
MKYKLVSNFKYLYLQQDHWLVVRIGKPAVGDLIHKLLAKVDIHHGGLPDSLLEVRGAAMAAFSVFEHQDVGADLVK